MVNDMTMESFWPNHLSSGLLLFLSRDPLTIDSTLIHSPYQIVYFLFFVSEIGLV